MTFISVTRLRLRSVRFFPSFALHTWRSTRQVKIAKGFLDGQFSTEGKLAFWTLTAWVDEESMRLYRNTDAHMRAMPRLIEWCDEASMVHWEQEENALPSPSEALSRMLSGGRLSKVRYPSV